MPKPGPRTTISHCATMVYGQETPMNFSIEFEQEADGRWLAEIPELPGVLAYGATADEAMGRAEILALRVLAERIENGELRPVDLRISVPAAA